jgi:hypothetical protein
MIKRRRGAVHVSIPVGGIVVTNDEIVILDRRFSPSDFVSAQLVVRPQRECELILTFKHGVVKSFTCDTLEGFIDTLRGIEEITK